MARKKKEDESGGGAPEWMNTFSDMMTLLMCFFVLLFAMSSVDTAKFNAFAAALSSSSAATLASILENGGENLISEMAGNGIIEFPAPPNNVVPTDAEENYHSEEENPEISDMYNDYAARRLADAQKELGEITGDLWTYFAETANDGQSDGLGSGTTDFDGTGLSIEQEDFYIKISLAGGVSFESGTHNLTEQAVEDLDIIAEVLAAYPDNQIEVEGYTDNVPIRQGSKYEDNRVLSTYRAMEVTKFLISRGLNPLNIKPSGWGEYYPVADNDTPEGRALNRRVEIKIYSTVYTNGL